MESIEILAVVESVSNEKGIEEEIIFSALEISVLFKFGNSFFSDNSISDLVKVSLFILFTQL